MSWFKQIMENNYIRSQKFKRVSQFSMKKTYLSIHLMEVNSLNVLTKKVQQGKTRLKFR